MKAGRRHQRTNEPKYIFTEPQVGFRMDKGETHPQAEP